VQSAVAQTHNCNLTVTPKTNNWDSYTVLIHNRAATDAHVACRFKPSGHSVQMDVTVARESDTSSGYSAGNVTDGARDCAAVAMSAVHNVLLDPCIL
jgi:hypothetical protein